MGLKDTLKKLTGRSSGSGSGSGSADREPRSSPAPAPQARRHPVVSGPSYTRGDDAQFTQQDQRHDHDEYNNDPAVASEGLASEGQQHDPSEVQPFGISAADTATRPHAHIRDAQITHPGAWKDYPERPSSSSESSLYDSLSSIYDEEGTKVQQPAPKLARPDMPPPQLSVDFSAPQEPTSSVSVDRTVEQRNAVVHEEIQPHVHTVYHPQRTRSIHIHEHRTVIQPVIDPTPRIGPAQHWLRDHRTGEMQKITAEQARELEQAGQLEQAQFLKQAQNMA